MPAPVSPRVASTCSTTSPPRGEATKGRGCLLPAGVGDGVSGRQGCLSPEVSGKLLEFQVSPSQSRATSTNRPPPPPPAPLLCPLRTNKKGGLHAGPRAHTSSVAWQQTTGTLQKRLWNSAFSGRASRRSGKSLEGVPHRTRQPCPRPQGQQKEWGVGARGNGSRRHRSPVIRGQTLDDKTAE